MIGQAPALPQMREVLIPDAPDASNVSLPDAPAFLALSTHQFGGMNLHEDWLAKFDDIPELQLLEPLSSNVRRAMHRPCSTTSKP